MSIYRLTGSRELNVKAVVAAFNQEKALVGAFSVIVQLQRLIVYSTIQTRNPFVSLTAEEPSNAQVSQRKLKGPGLEERVEMFTLFGDLLGKMTAGLPYDNEVGAKFMEGMARDIKQQKERIGGNWAVAFVANKIARVKAR